MFTTDRDLYRKTFFAAWQKAQSGQALTPLEHQIVQIVRQHPEYHALMNDSAASLHRDYPPEAGVSNPFLHIALHMTMLEQISSDQPRGIRNLYQQALASGLDPHDAEHQMMECLAEALWHLQQTETPFDEARYLRCIGRVTTRARTGGKS